MLMEDDVLVGCYCQGCCRATTFSLLALCDCIIEELSSCLKDVTKGFRIELMNVHVA